MFSFSFYFQSFFIAYIHVCDSRGLCVMFFLCVRMCILTDERFFLGSLSVCIHMWQKCYSRYVCGCFQNKFLGDFWWKQIEFLHICFYWWNRHINSQGSTQHTNPFTHILLVVASFYLNYLKNCSYKTKNSLEFS